MLYFRLFASVIFPSSSRKQNDQLPCHYLQAYRHPLEHRLDVTMALGQANKPLNLRAKSAREIYRGMKQL